MLPQTTALGLFVAKCLALLRVFLQVTYGDFAESPLETLSALSQEVILPVLSNPMNRNGWPDVVSKEVTENLHKFIANGKQTGLMACALPSYTAG